MVIKCIFTEKYNFLINDFNPKYKYFTLILQTLKSLTFIVYDNI